MRNLEVMRTRAMLDYAIEDRQKLEAALLKAVKVESDRALEYAAALKKAAVEEGIL